MVGSMNFINLPQRQRRLVEVPSGEITKVLNAGYDKAMGVSVVELPYSGSHLSLILMLPGKPSEFVAGGLPKIEEKLNATTWNGMLGRMAPYNLNLKVPFYSHR